jgi:hypothetical protein
MEDDGEAALQIMQQGAAGTDGAAGAGRPCHAVRTTDAPADDTEEEKAVTTVSVGLRGGVSRLRMGLAAALLFAARSGEADLIKTLLDQAGRKAWRAGERDAHGGGVGRALTSTGCPRAPTWCCTRGRGTSRSGLRAQPALAAAD